MKTLLIDLIICLFDIVIACAVLFGVISGYLNVFFTVLAILSLVCWAFVFFKDTVNLYEYLGGTNV